jgi:hypothetical protein
MNFYFYHDLSCAVSELDEQYHVPSRAERQLLAVHELEAARSWLLRAPPGAKRVYHEGHLGRDRFSDPEANGLANLFAWAELIGLVMLVQERRTPSVMTEDGLGFKQVGSHAYLAYRTSVIWQMSIPVFTADGHWATAALTADPAMGVA